MNEMDECVCMNYIGRGLGAVVWWMEGELFIQQRLSEHTTSLHNVTIYAPEVTLWF